MATQVPLIVENGQIRQFASGDQLLISGQKFPTADGGAGEFLKTDGSGNLSWGNAVISASATFYISTTGSDTTGDGTSGNPWATITKVISYLSTRRIVTDAVITIQFADGTYSYSAQQVWRHPDSPTCVIQGTNTYDKTMSSVVSSSGGAGAWSIVIQLNSVANIAVNDYIVMLSSSNGTNPRLMLGCHKVTNVDTGNVRITVTSRSLNAGAPSGAVTGTVTVLKSIFYSTVNGALVIYGAVLTVQNMALVNSTNTNALLVASSYSEGRIQGKVGLYDTYITTRNFGQWTIYDNCCASGGVFGVDVYGSGTVFIWGNTVVTGAAWGAISSRQGAYIYVGGSCQIGGNTTGLLSQNRGYIYSINNIYFGNTTQSSPAINTVGATLEYVYSSGDTFA
jgi:hypothetical protein